MVGKNNKKLLMEMGANKFKRYTLKKLSIGVASVSIGIGLMFGATEQVSAQAEAGTVIEHDESVNQDITPQSEQQEPEIDHVLEAKRQEVNAYLVSSNLQYNRDQFKAQIDQATSVSELVNIENQINEAIAEQVEETEKNNQLSEEEQEQKPQDTQVSDEKQSEELEKKRKAVKDELGKSEIVIWDDYLALLNKINEATSIEELDAISAEIRGDKAPEKQEEKEQEADNTIEQSVPATPQQPQVDVQQDTSKPEVEYTLDQVRHFFNQEEIAKIEAGQMTIKQALQKALGTQPDIKTNQNHHEENVLAAGVENLDNKQEEQTGKRRTRRNTGNVDLNRKFGLNDNFMSVIEYINALENSGYLNVEESLMFKRAALRRFGNEGRPSNELANDRPNDNGQKWNDFLKSSNKNVFKDKITRDLLEVSFSSYTNNGRNRGRTRDYNRTIEIATKAQDYIKNRDGKNQQLIIDGKEDTSHELDKFSPDNIDNVKLSNGKYTVTLEMEKYSKLDTRRQYAYDIYMIQLKKSTDDKLSSQPKITDTTGKSGTLTRKEINGGKYVQYIYKRNYDYNISDTPKGLLGKKVQFNLEFKDPLDPIEDQISSYYLGDTYSTQAWNGAPNQSFIHYKNEDKVLRQLSDKMSELQVQQLFNSIDEKIKEFTNTYIKLPDSSGTKIVNNKNYNKLNNLKNEIDSLYRKTKESIERITQGTTKQSLLQRLQGGRVNGRFQEGYKQDIARLADFNINDRNGNGIIDEIDVKNAENKINEIKRKHSELQEKIKTAETQKPITNHHELINLYESLKASIQEANDTRAENSISQIPASDDVYQDGQSFNQKRQELTNSLPNNLSNLNLPVAPPTQKVELSNLDGLSGEQKEQVKANLKANNPELDLSNVTVAADGTVTVQWDEHNSVTVDKSETVELKVNKDALKNAIDKANETTDSEFYGKLEELDPNLKSEYDKAKEQAEITFNNNKASQTDVDDATNKLSELESKISEREQIEVTKKFNQAQAKVKDAQQAAQAAKDATTAAESDGLITPDEASNLKGLNNVVEAAKAEAEEAVRDLPTGATKESLEQDLEDITTTEVPEVTDANANGILDATEISEAQAKVKEAQQAAQAAKDATTAAESDGLITPDEASNLKGLNNVVEAAKAEAEEAVRDLPTGATKESLEQDLEDITTTEVPEVTDANANGILDATEISEAQAKVKEAQQAAQAAKDATTAAESDGLITPDEASNLKGLNNVVEAAKAEAEEAVRDLPTGATKESLEQDLEDITTTEVPEVTDANANGILDATEISEAQAKVKEAQQAAQAAKDATTAAESDGLITPDEASNLKGLNNVVEAAKAEAEEAVRDLPTGATKESLEQDLEDITTTEVPEVTDANANGILDATEISEAQAKVKEAQQAAQAAKDATTAAESDGLITPDEASNLKGLNNVVEAAKAEAEEAVRDLPTGATKESLEQDLEDITTTEVPEVTDANANGILDATEISEAQAKVKEAQQAAQAAKDATTAAESDGLITPDEASNLKGLNNVVEAAKAEAEEAVRDLPTGATKESLEQDLEDITTTEVPEVTDANANGILDATEISEAQAKVKEAQQAAQAAKDATTAAESDGLITPDEASNLKGLNNVVEAAKAEAEEAVRDLPTGATKESLEQDLEDITTTEVPEVTDANANGILDATEISEAQAKVKEAQQAAQAAKDATTAAESDGLITPDEASNLKGLNNVVEAAKAEAEEAVRDLPTGATKESLEQDLEDITTTEVPEVTDANANGILDATEISEAQAKVKEAQQAAQAAKDATTAAESDGLITPDEASNLKGLNNVVEAAKAEAEEAVRDLPTGATKESLEQDLEDITTTEVPEVTDANANGILDATEISEAQAKVKEAQQAAQAAKDATTAAESDGLITPDEASNLKGLNNVVEAAKAEAEEAVRDLPTGATKESLEQDLEDITTTEVPEVTDANANGILDATEISEAQAKVKEAQQAAQAAKDATTAAESDGLITPDEASNLKGLNNVVEAAKAEAEEAVRDLPTGATKESLEQDLEDITTTEVPEVTDANANGILDATEISEAQAKVKEAQQAAQAAKDATTAAESDGLITPDEASNLKGLNNVVEAAKAEAEEAVRDLPTGATKESLEQDLEDITTTEVPEVTDANANGILDATEISEAQAKVKEAQQAAQAAKDATTAAESDGLITPDEASNLKGLNNVVEAAKAEAEEAVRDLPTGATKESLEQDLEDITTTEVPEVTDANANGILDATEISEAQAKVKEAQQAAQAAKDATTAAESDGLITPDEASNLKGLNNVVEAAKAEAEEAVRDLPTGATKESLEQDLEDITTTEVPEVTDANANGILDATEISEAQAKVKEAQQAAQAAKDATTAAESDGLITPDEASNLKGLNNVVEAAKAEAEEAVRDLPTGATKESLEQDLEDITTTEVPEVTDANANGILDATEISEAQAKVKEAQQAAQAAKDATTAAESDGLITPDEASNLKGLNNVVEAAKAEAEEAVRDLPTGATKESLEQDLEDITTTEVPEVTDANANGILDATEISEAQAKVKEAQQAAQAAKDATTAAESDGLITPDEASNLKGLNNVVEAAKAEAEEAVRDLPTGATKESLEQDLEDITTTEVPEVTDANANGILDATEISEAQAKVKEAQQAAQAAKDATTAAESDGLITPDEASNLKGLNNVVEAAKAEAEEAVRDLPTGATKESLEQDLEDITTTEVPEVTDANANGILDATEISEAQAKVKEAQQAAQAAKDATTAAESDGLITPDEASNLKGLNNVVEAAKAEAEEAVRDLPTGATKESLEQDLEDITTTEVPEVTDANANGILDATEISEAQAKVKEAQQAAQAAKDATTAAESDGLITPDEASNLKGLNNVVEAAKAEAEEAVRDLPTGATKESLEQDLEDITTTEVPEVTDANANGILDATEISEAQAKVKEAQQAAQAAKDATTAAESDGLITPDEASNLKGLNNVVEAAKAEAEEAVRDLPTGATKESLEQDLEDITTTEVPEVTDANANGILDATEISEAQAKVKEAQQAAQAAKDATTAAESDGLITPDEASNLKGLNNVVEAAKAEAEEAVRDLPTGATKESLEQDLEDITTTEVPEVTDANANGILDATEISEAQAKVKEAQQAAQAAKDATTAAESDGLITPDEASNLKGLNNVVEAAKAEAEEAVRDLPTGATKESLEQDLEDITTTEVPEVTDANANGILDATEISEAQAKVKEAQQAAQAAKDATTAAESDGLITPDEASNLKGLNNVVEAAKAEAEEAVRDLPTGATKESLEQDLEDITTTEVPEVTDANANGILDATEISEAQAKVKEAQQAAQAAKDATTAAESDGLITPDEASNLKGLNNVVEAAKAEAEEAVRDLPTGATKESLEQDLEDITTTEVPEVTDANANGILDATEISEAQAKVKEAQQAAQAAKDATTAAESDGLITPDEASNLKGLNNVVEAAKAEAEEAVRDLPTGATKESLEQDLEDITTTEVPEVTDANANGILDATEISEAQAKVKEAQQAAQAAKDATTAAESDGLITPDEASNLKGLNNVVEAAKAEAEEAVRDLPTGATKESLEQDLEDITTTEVPEVTDANANGILDATEISEAQAKVKEAQQAAQAAKDATTAAESDGLITPDEASNLKGLNNVVEAAKAEAEEAVRDLPTGATKESLEQDLEDITTTEVPEVTDANANGILDATEISEAQAKVKEAQQAAQAAKDATTAAESDGLITPDEASNLKGLNNVVEAAKAEAEEAVRDLPTGATKESLEQDLEDITTTEVPEVTDANANGILDATEISEAQAKVKEAQQAAQAAKDATTAAESDGLITPDEASNLKGLNNVVEAAKAEAEEAVRDLPTGATKESLEQDLEDITTTEVPEVTDANANGILDATEISEAQAKVKEAQQAAQAAKDATTAAESDGLITPDEASNLKGLNNVVEAAKAEAEEAVRDLPTGATKESLEQDLEDITTTEVPEVTDANANGILDATEISEAQAKVKEAQQAAQAAKDATTAAESDGLITPDEASNLKGLNNVVEAAKAEAEEAVRDLPTGATKESLEQDLEDITTTEVPEVTDANANGILDATEISEAQAKVKEAQQAAQAAKDATTAAESDGLITPDEASNLKGLNNVVEAAKAEAEEAVRDLPTGATKESLEQDLEDITTTEVPEVTDANANGILDATEISEAQAKVKEAQQAAQAAKDATTAAESDGLITPDEASNLKGLNNVVEAAKAEAEEAVRDLPTGATKESLEQDLEDITTTEVPEVTDANANGILDATEISEAQAKVKEAQQAAQAAKDATTAAESDGLITPDEASNLKGLNNVVEAAKAEAEEAVRDLPTGATKESLEQDLEDITTTEVPEVTDANANGILDATEISEAQAKVKEAQQAAQAAKDATTAAESDGLITPDEASNLKGLNNVVEAAKAEAEEAVRDLPTGATKESLEQDLEDITTTEVPEVTDANANGILDATEISEAQAKVKEAQQAAQAAKDATTAAESDGLITPDEASNLKGLNNVVEAAKAEAEEAVRDLPTGATKESLEQDLEDITTTEVPEVTDANANGILDATEISEAQAKVKEAQQAAQAAKDATTAAESDGLITPDEASNLKGLNNVVEAAKAEAEEAVRDLPTGATKESLEQDLEDITTTEVPEVTDANANGILDATEISEAQAKVKEAQQAAQAAKDATTAAESDGLITPDEASNLKGLNNVVEAAKAEAEEAVRDLPTGATKESLEQDLEDITTTEVPEVTDANANGILDATEISEAQAKVKEAQQAAQAAKDATTAAESDGLITPDEASNLKGLNNVVEAAKAEAEEAVRDLPTGATKESLEQDLEDITTTEVPEVTDANANGIMDKDEWESGLGLINEKPEFPAEELERLLQVERDKAADYIAGLQNLDASKVKEFQVAIQKAQTVPAIEEIVQAAEKLNAKSAQSTPDSGNGAGTTQPEKPEFEGGVNGQGLINEKPTFPAEELERLLQVERDKAANYIASLPNLDISKVNEFKAAIQKAQTVPVIEEIIQAAEKLNTELGRGKVGGEQEQPAEPEAPTQPGQAESERPADKPAVTDHLQNAKTQAEATINSLSHLTQSQKDQFIASVHAATTVGQIHQIVEEARYMNDQQAIQESIKQAKSGERLPETATGSWLLGLSGISSLLVGLGLKKKREDDDK
ncbi:GA-like domain-containing protein [Dolosigranulum pigrum]|uniref:GA-like domain-containing protein n=1 Tax=Dolosigranulum pigrum TaxID=29394 RepID=UPI001AD88BAB|nr:YSIRK-type signal peptide-containing protein [Dolosigranulum pigrum]QTJ58197.1 YSIRK-type signal peptide-containing protein [Dolosigranulum pigrum]